MHQNSLYAPVFCIICISVSLSYLHRNNLYCKDLASNLYQVANLWNHPYFFEGVSLKFPTHVLISPWVKFQIQRILKRKAFYVLCLLEYNGNFRLVDFETVDPPSGHAVLVGQNDLDEPQTTRHDDALSVALPLHLYPSLSQLPVVDWILWGSAAYGICANYML